MFSTLCWKDFVPLNYKESAHLAIIHLFLTRRTKNQPDSDKKEERKNKKRWKSSFVLYLILTLFFPTDACFFLGQTLSFQKQETYIKFYKNGSNSSGDPQVMYEKFDICQAEA